MRMLCCLLLTVTACTSHVVRCDRHLLRINPPSAAMPAGSAAPTPTPTPAPTRGAP